MHRGNKQFFFFKYLHLNVSKTKEMCINFRKNKSNLKPVWIKREVVERVSWPTHKYPGVMFDNKLRWNQNISCIIKKENTS